MARRPRQLRFRTRPDRSAEDELRAEGFRRIAGVDEVGRGPLAGPVCAAAVVLDLDRLPPEVAGALDDSKRLSAQARERLAPLIRESGAVGLGQASVEEVESLNIHAASQLAMARAVADLSPAPDVALVDGPWAPPGLLCPARPMTGGDRLSLSIAAASVVAKVWRDGIMRDLAQQHPGYGWERNAGYGSKSHIAALQTLGPTPHHRRTFAPIHKMLWQEGG
jgi:ribonuclease HII